MDIYMPYINKTASDSQAVRFGRLSGVMILLVGIGSAILLIHYSDRPVFLYLMNLYGLFTPGIATMFLLGVFWKGATEKGALAAGLLTIPLSIALNLAFPQMPFFNRTGIVFWSCMVISVVVSLVTKPRPEAQLKGLMWNRSVLRVPENERKFNTGLRNTGLWWALITVVVLYFYIRYA